MAYLHGVYPTEKSETAGITIDHYTSTSGYRYSTDTYVRQSVRGG